MFVILIFDYIISSINAKREKLNFFLVVTAREGLVGEGLSVLNSKKGWKDGFKSLADFLIGNFDKKLTFITQYQSL